MGGAGKIFVCLLLQEYGGILSQKSDAAGVMVSNTNIIGADHNMLIRSLLHEGRGQLLPHANLCLQDEMIVDAKKNPGSYNINICNLLHECA